MNEKDVVELLRLYRHDMMNDLQIVQGYASMGKMDKVESKLTEWTARLQEERKLMSLQAPAFALWVIQFHSHYDNIRLTYQIDMETIDLHIIDHTLEQACFAAVDCLLRLGDDRSLYQGVLKLQHANSAIRATFMLEGNFTEIDSSIVSDCDDYKIKKEDNGVSCIITIPFTE